MSRKKEVTIGITINLENYENLRLEVQGDAETHEDVDDLVSFLDGMLSRFGRGDPATAERVDAYRRRVLALRPTKPEAQAPRVETVASMTPVPAGPGSVQQNIEGTSPAPHAIEAAVPPAPKQSEPVSKPIAGTPKQPEPTPVSKPIAGTPKQPEPTPEPEPIAGAPKQPEPTSEPEPIAGTQEQPEPTPEPEPIAGTQEQPEPTPEPEPIAGAPKQPEPTPVSKPIAGAPKQPEPGPAGAKPPAAGEGEVCETCGAEVTKSQAKLSNLFMNKTLCKKCMEQP